MHPNLPAHVLSILKFDEKFGFIADPPPFLDNVKNFVVFFMASLSKRTLQKVHGGVGKGWGAKAYAKLN